MLQTGNIYVGGGANGYAAGTATFNFTGGTLQAAPAGNRPGLTKRAPITVGTAASNMATIDANGQSLASVPGSFPARAN